MDNLTPKDSQLLQQAQALVALLESEAYQTYLKPFLMELAHQGYPNPKDYQSNEKLLLDYTHKVGETEAIKKLLDFLDSQRHVTEQILKKNNEKEAYKQWTNQIPFHKITTMTTENDLMQSHSPLT